MQKKSRLGWPGDSQDSKTQDPTEASSQRRVAEARALAEQDFEYLYDHYYRYLNYYFLVRGCSREECQDLVQETFLRAYRGSRRFRADSSVRTWLLKIAGNTFQNCVRDKSALKRNAKVVSLEELQRDPSLPAEGRLGDPSLYEPLDRILGVERRNLLQEALRDLPPRMRTCLRLRIHDDLKYREIATLMQISIQTVKSQLNQARRRLKESLSKHFDDEDFED